VINFEEAWWLNVNFLGEKCLKIWGEKKGTRSVIDSIHVSPYGWEWTITMLYILLKTL
jgi:hypothetical protein